MDKDKTLILSQTNPAIDMVYQKWIRNGYHAAVIFWNPCKLIRVFRRIWIQNHIPLEEMWYGKWKKQLVNYNTVIIHATQLTNNLPEWIQKHQREMRIIYWYWNPVDVKSSPQCVRGDKVEFWSFDKKDCKKYGMKSNIQYYCKDESIVKKSAPILYDIYFIGHNKGRDEQINLLREIAEKQLLICRFRVFKEKEKFVPYYIVEEEITHARAILEVNQKGQVGLTLRAMEALFWDKKLITTNASIIDEPFYRSKNIFVLGMDDIEKLREFIFSPYDNDVSIYKSIYHLDSWYNNFG